MSKGHNETILLAMQRLDEATALLRSIMGARIDQPEIVPVDEAFLEVSPLTVDFGYYTTRLHNVFRNGVGFHDASKHWEYVTKEIVTMRDVVSLREAHWLNVTNIGKGSVDRLKVVLAAHGLHLGMAYQTKEQAHAKVA